MYAVVAVLIICAIYLINCVVRPYTACPRCSGSGKRRSSSGKSFANCGRCSGSGRRVRLGRRLIDGGDRR